MKGILAIYFATMLFIASGPCMAESKTITMSIYVSPEESARARLQFLIYTEAFKRLGYQFKFQIAPLTRGSSDANKGKGGCYRIDYIRGTEFIRLRATPFVAPDSITSLNAVDQALHRLISNRADLFVYDELDLTARLNTSEFRGKIVSAGMMEEIPAYGFLHKKYQALVEALAKVLRDMKREGLMEKFREQVI